MTITESEDPGCSFVVSKDLVCIAMPSIIVCADADNPDAPFRLNLDVSGVMLLDFDFITGFMSTLLTHFAGLSSSLNSCLEACPHRCASSGSESSDDEISSSADS